MARTITVTRLAQQVTTIPGLQSSTLGYIFQMTASGGVSMPNEIFRMNQRPVDPNNLAGPVVNDFQGVCTPLDLTTLSINSPATGQTQFRVAQVSLTFANESDADSAWTGIKGDVQSLKSALDAGDRLNLVDTFVPV